MTYANHEAVPHRENVLDYFSEVDLFRVNHLVLPLSHEIGESTRFWRRRTGHGQYMLAYDNGKAAVRVLPERVVPQSVHRWRALKPEEKLRLACSRDGEGGGEAPQLVNRSAMADPRELNFEQVLECVDPCVLHYTGCGFDWLRDKYRLLGNFPSSWFGGKLPIAPCFHLDARDAMRGGTAAPDETKSGAMRDGTAAPDETKSGAMRDGSAASGETNSGATDDEEDRSRELYHREVMLCREKYAEEIRAQLEHGVLRVITGPASVIEQARRDARGSLGSRMTPATAVTIAGSSRPCTETRKEDGVRDGAQATPVTEVPAAVESAVDGPAPRFGAALGAAGPGRFPTAIDSLDSQGDASSGFESSWILAACARDFL